MLDHKLNTYGVRGSIISIVESFLQNRAIKMVPDGQSSTPHDINDLPNGAFVRIGIYVDDTTAYSSIFDRLQIAAARK